MRPGFRALRVDDHHGHVAVKKKHQTPSKTFPAIGFESGQDRLLAFYSVVQNPMSPPPPRTMLHFARQIRHLDPRSGADQYVLYWRQVQECPIPKRKTELEAQTSARRVFR
eukprot:3315055-Rhodomonas_salina.1